MKYLNGSTNLRQKKKDNQNVQNIIIIFRYTIH